MLNTYTYRMPTLVVGEVIKQLRYNACKVVNTGKDLNGYTDVTFYGDDKDKRDVLTVWKSTVKSLKEEED